MIQAPVYNNISYLQPSNYSMQYFNKLMSQNLDDIHRIYYPDLAQDEYISDAKTRNETLYKRNKLQQLAKYGSNTNCEMIYNKIKENPDFIELINSKYLNNAQSFVKLVSAMDNLEKQRIEKITRPYSQYANVLYYSPIAYEKYNINDYLHLLNNFTKNPAISEDLKLYFLSMKADKIDVYYTRLDKLNTSANPVKILTEDLSYSKE